MPDHLHYNVLLVLFSIIVALLSCFAALDLTERLVRDKRTPSFILYISCVLGVGLWSAHFMGMMAIELEMAVSYSLPLILLSLCVPIAASYILLVLFNHPRTRNKLYLGFGGLLFGSGLQIMHYCGRLATNPSLEYEQSRLSIAGSVLFSLIIPVVTVSFDSNWVRNSYNMFTIKKIMLMLTLTGALLGTHYSAMAGASFVTPDMAMDTGKSSLLSDSVLELILACAFLLMVTIVFILLYRDRQRVLHSSQFNEQRYMALFEFSPDMVICIDPVRQNVISVNPSLRQTTGFGTEELGNYKNVMYTGQDEEALKTAVKRAAEGESSKLELSVTTKGGRRLVCSATVFPLVHDKQNFVYIVAEDVTALAEYQQELIVAKNAAESAARMKSEFLATMSHEIRTPLNGIIGINQLLTEEIRLPEHLDLLKLQNTSSHALLKVMNDILDISRLEAENLLLYREPFQLAAMLQECMDLFAVNASDKNLSLKLQLEPSIPQTVVGDSARIRQILVNLIGNAVKFTHAGEVSVIVEPYNSAGAALDLQFTVKDTGIGISPDKLRLLFQPFSQVDASHSRSYPGTGLGLAICKKLVDLMNGEIWAAAADGGGTEFSFRITLQTIEQIGTEAV
ncbi:ATP-binding protein [Paenibacillus sp. BAC0078]